MKFAYVTFVNNNSMYLFLMQSAIEAVLIFSTFPIIVYCVDVPNEVRMNYLPFDSERVIFRHISDAGYRSIFYYKPHCILDSIEKGLEAGYYIESDDLITPNCDLLYNTIASIDKIPLSPIHPNDVSPSLAYMSNLHVRKTQHYIHGHVLFAKSTLKFLQKWMHNCLASTGENEDESALNCTYWQYDCKDHYLPIIDPYFEYFYTESNHRMTAASFHGCKDPVQQFTLLKDMQKHYSS